MNEIEAHERNVRAFFARKPFCYKSMTSQESILFCAALTHDSYCSEAINFKTPVELQSYERLEFLGDAVLEMITCEYVYLSSEYKEGRMTDFKQDVVANRKISERVLEYGLNIDDIMLVGHGHRDKKKNIVEDSMRADAFEAIIGAIYLTKGFDEAKRIVREVLLPHD